MDALLYLPTQLIERLVNAAIRLSLRRLADPADEAVGAGSQPSHERVADSEFVGHESIEQESAVISVAGSLGDLPSAGGRGKGARDVTGRVGSVGGDVGFHEAP